MNNSSDIIQVGIIGYGFMGRTHAKAYQDAQLDGYPIKVSAIANRDIQSKIQSDGPGNFNAEETEINLDGVALHNDADSIINDPQIELVSICTHTDTHVDLAIAALKAGKHVLVEKPVALNPADVERLAAIAAESDCLCIPAMCMRHWPAWKKIKEIIESNKYGSTRSAVFHRLGSRPDWAVDFYKDQSRSGGVLHDLHIHDTDFIYHCFGKPNAVTTHGDDLHVTTFYDYSDIPHVTAQAAWDNQPSFGFQIRCTITFENATLDFDLNRDDQLLLYQEQRSEPIAVDSLTGYDHQIRSLLDQIQSNSTCSDCMHEAYMVSKILNAESQSMSCGVIESVSY